MCSLQAELCTAAARLLLSMVFFSQAAAEQLARLGALTRIMQALPGPAAPSSANIAVPLTAGVAPAPAAAPASPLPPAAAAADFGEPQEHASSSVGQPVVVSALERAAPRLSLSLGPAVCTFPLPVLQPCPLNAQQLLHQLFAGCCCAHHAVLTGQQ